jgi:hypothetical protein
VSTLVTENVLKLFLYSAGIANKVTILAGYSGVDSSPSGPDRLKGSFAERRPKLEDDRSHLSTDKLRMQKNENLFLFFLVTKLDSLSSAKNKIEYI